MKPQWDDFLRKTDPSAYEAKDKALLQPHDGIEKILHGISKPKRKDTVRDLCELKESMLSQMLKLIQTPLGAGIAAGLSTDREKIAKELDRYIAIRLDLDRQIEVINTAHATSVGLKIPGLSPNFDLATLASLIPLLDPKVDVSQIRWLSSRYKEVIAELKPFGPQLMVAYDGFKKKFGPVWERFEQLKEKLSESGGRVMALERSFYANIQSVLPRRDDNPCRKFKL